MYTFAIGIDTYQLVPYDYMLSDYKYTIFYHTSWIGSAIDQLFINFFYARIADYVRAWATTKIVLKDDTISQTYVCKLIL